EGRAAAQQPLSRRPGDPAPGSIDGDVKRIEMLALEDGQAAVTEMTAIVGRVELAAEPTVPALLAAERRQTGQDSRENPAILIRPQLGNDQALAAKLADEREGNAHASRN